MPLDDPKGKGPGAENTEALQENVRARQDQVTPDASLLEPLFGLGFEFLELHTPSATRTLRSGKVVKVGKAPIHKRWTTAEPLGEVDAYNCLVAGKNVGVRLRDCDLVIDVDPRNGGLLPLEHVVLPRWAEPAPKPRRIN